MEGNKNELLEKRVAELKEKLGLQSNEPPQSTFFQGDFGYSIDFSVLIPLILLFCVGSIFVVRFIKRRKTTKLS